MSRLPLLHRLDPRPADVAQREPFAEAVNIPLEAIPGRVYELPAKGLGLQVSSGPVLYDQCAAVLAALGRSATRSEPTPATTAHAGRLWSVNGFLDYMLPSLPQGRALDLGCGVGRDSVYLAANGWTVQAVDQLPDALERAADLEQRYRPPEAKKIAWTLAALADFPGPVEEVDLITLFFTPAAGVLTRVQEWLRPGGWLLIETFSSTHCQQFGKPRLDRVISPERIRSLRGWAVRSLTEGWHGDRHTIRAQLIRE